MLVDQNARALIVIAPDGRVARTMSAPKPTDLPQLSLAANAATDPGGRLVYRVNLRRPSSALAQRMDSGQYVKTVMHDSAAIVRADFNSRTVDTVGVEAMPVRVSLRYSAGSGGGAGRPSVNPLPQTDEWAMLADGTIAIVRGQDYHIDWIHPDGTHTSSPKMQFAWRRVTLEEKQRMLDSARRADSASEAAAQRFTAQQAARGAGRGGGLPGLLPYSTVDPPDMPDYYPPIRAGTVFADPDGNLWILPTTSAIVSDALVYDVVDRSGAVVERVLLPPKRKLLAVGHAGVLYLANYSGDYFKIERARVLK